MEPISEARIQPLHPELKRRLENLDQRLEASSLKVTLRITQGLRTWAQQDALYAEGRTTAGIPCVHDGVTRPIGTCAEHPLGWVVTKARGGESMHNFAGAADGEPNDPGFVSWHPDLRTTDSRWKLFLTIAKDCGLAEGAEWRTFPDKPHLYPQELPPTPDDSMRAAFLLKGDIADVWSLWATRFGLPTV